MPVARRIETMMARSSWIRKMFDEGARLKALHGADKVFDFSLGNPVEEPSERVAAVIREVAADPTPGGHRYMPNAGYPAVREAVAQALAARSGLPFTGAHVVMTVGAGGGLNVVLKALLDPGDEVAIVAPYFAEYLFYIDNHGGAPKIAQAGDRFQVDPAEIERVLSPKTRALILNSPNNPTGVVYTNEALAAVGALLAAKGAEYGRPIWLIMDEPYRKLLYPGFECPDPFGFHDHTILVTSHSKDLNLPGERIGYAAVSPKGLNPAKVVEALTLTNRILGFVNAPALMQKVAARLQDEQPDMTGYRRNRDLLVNGLTEIGYELTPPGGGFYLFPRSPLDDDIAFVDLLKKRNVLVVPGTGFGWPGAFRISFAVETETCEKALPGFRAAFEEARK
ncbi:MAG: pyridoxal phosphate-dependent aminotransferase [Nitrospinae bacterium]|nr:pyridoxal phosphate-dependent aminotransferase [Nitrospinota bacterium]